MDSSASHHRVQGPSPQMTQPAPGRASGSGSDPAARAPAPVAARRLAVIHNPAAGWRREARFWRTLRALEAEGCSFEVHRTDGPGAAHTLAAQAAPCDVLVVAGGDGTVNEALNGLAERGDSPPLAVIPLGTANVLAGELGLPDDPDGVARAIAHGPVVRAHLGRARGPDGARRFAMMAGAGFDAQVVARVRRRFKRRLGKAAFLLAGVEAGLGYAQPRLRVEVDGTIFAAAQVVVCKGHYYAGRYVLAPDARPWDPELHVCLFQRFGPLQPLRYALAMQLGRLGRLPDYRVVPARRVRITGADGDPVQGDGDLIARLPAEIELLEDAVRFVVAPGA